jgi:N-methylhydantoinase A
MKDVGLGRALVPRYPGVTSALGCVIADMRHDYVQTINAVLDAVDPAALATAMREHAAGGLKLLAAAGVTLDAKTVRFEFDMAYLGQTHTVPVPFEIAVDAAGDPAPFSIADIAAAFEDAYRGVYGRLLEGGTMRVLNLRTAVIGTRPKFDLGVLAPTTTGGADQARTGTRPVYVDGAWHDAGIYARLELPVDSVVEGPAILEQPDTTIFVEPDLYATVDRFGNLVIARKSDLEGA